MTSSSRLNKSDYPWLLQPPVHRVVVAQLVVGVFLSVALLPQGVTSALSALLGALCCLLPNAYFIWRAFRYRGARAARQITRSFYQGEAGKLVLTVLLFTLIFSMVKPVEPLALFGAFMLVQLVNWFTPLLLAGRPGKNS